jgi:hypothetical protein
VVRERPEGLALLVGLSEPLAGEEPDRVEQPVPVGVAVAGGGDERDQRLPD